MDEGLVENFATLQGQMGNMGEYFLRMTMVISGPGTAKKTLFENTHNPNMRKGI